VGWLDHGPPGDNASAIDPSSVSVSSRRDVGRRVRRSGQFAASISTVNKMPPRYTCINHARRASLSGSTRLTPVGVGPDQTRHRTGPSPAATTWQQQGASSSQRANKLSTPAALSIMHHPQSGGRLSVCLSIRLMVMMMTMMISHAHAPITKAMLFRAMFTICSRRVSVRSSVNNRSKLSK